MATTTDARNKGVNGTKITVEGSNEELKHLGFAKVAYFNILMYGSSFYEYVKENSGPLKSGIGKVEGIVSPVLDKFRDVPAHLLGFLDQKVDLAANKFDEHAPPVAKRVASQARSMVHKALGMTYSLASEAQTRGVGAAACSAATKSRDFLTEHMIKAWWTLNRVPPFRMVAQVTVPRAAQLSEKYNDVVTNMSQKGYTICSYLPLVPLDKIAMAFKKGKAVSKEKKSS
ncbi:hypothetical protein MKW94_024450 [Papaver nudicaule]|uniref:REF/SRPP-like protein n=1 Tax=Papaver nudicaule TaxID=74823 RepID=A0AA41W1D6_PAPNU|nr:hypothetical protein [Papaver nudicaule]